MEITVMKGASSSRCIEEAQAELVRDLAEMDRIVDVVREGLADGLGKRSPRPMAAALSAARAPVLLLEHHLPRRQRHATLPNSHFDSRLASGRVAESRVAWSPCDTLPKAMCKVIPVELLDDTIRKYKLQRDAVAGLPFSEDAVAFLDAHIEMFEDLRQRGEASADDSLTVKKAMAWSGLTRDALDSYPSIGSYSSRRWRRRDLPIRAPFSSETTPPADPGDRAPLQDEAIERDLMLQAALRESVAPPVRRNHCRERTTRPQRG